jgi:hypothetical protein
MSDSIYAKRGPLIEAAKKASSTRAQWMYHDAHDLRELAGDLQVKADSTQSTPGARALLEAAASLTRKAATLRKEHAHEVDKHEQKANQG